jgi:hypothetical protein
MLKEKEPETQEHDSGSHLLSGRGFCRLRICLVGFATRINGCAYAGGLILHDVFAALDEVFPLCPSAVYDFATASDILIDLLLALVDDLADLIGRLTPAGAQILRSFAGALRQIFPRFATALRSIENADQGAYTQSGQKPSHSLTLARIFAHNLYLLFAQYQEA